MAEEWTTSEVISENKKRRSKLFCEYNPVSGIGSQIERFPFTLYEEKSPIYLPLPMKEKYGGVSCLESESSKDEWEATFLEFMRDRMKLDFEFWAHWNIKIKPKGKSGGLIPFDLNWPQRYMLSILIKDFYADLPIRIILVKARQWGGSTLIQIFMMWIQVCHKTYWNSSIVADVESQSIGIRTMYETAIENYRPGIQKLSFQTYKGISDWKIIPERNCVISVASMQKPNKIRQQDISMAHCSEVGLWEKSEKKSPEDVIQALQGTILDIAGSVFVLESTAKGTGNFFHTTYLKADSGENNYTPVFIPWYKIELYTLGFDSPEERDKYIETFSEYEQFLWELGATIEGIHWYREKLRNYNNDKWRMGNEFPSTVEEAFAFSGRPVFNPSYTKNLKKDLRDPDLIGDIFPQNKEGEEAFKDIKVEEVNGGPLSIWAMPNDPPVPKGKVFENRYALFVDIGGTNPQADFSTISVIDRYYMAQGGLPEAVATFKAHIDQDLLSWKAAELAFFYEMGLLGVEVNSLNTIDDDTEGDHSYIILDKISNFYDNLYTRTSPEQIRQGVAVRWGFMTTHKSKGLIVDNYRGLIRNSGYVEYDKRAYDEARWFIVKPSGKLGNVAGQHDDLLISRMGALWLATSEDSGMGEPVLVDVSRNKILLKRPLVKTAARF